jgi:hypothetical protein
MVGSTFYMPQGNESNRSTKETVDQIVQTVCDAEMLPFSSMLTLKMAFYSNPSDGEKSGSTQKKR